MQLSQLALIVLTVIAMSIGQVLFKIVAISLDFSNNGILSNLFNIRLILAIVIYIVATALWILVLKITPLRVAYPFIALAFILVPVLGHFFLGESLSRWTFVGAFVIGLGVWVSVL